MGDQKAGPKSYALPEKELQAISIKFAVVIFFVFSVFFFSNDGTLKIFSINASSMVAMLMVAIYLSDSMIKGKFVLQKHSSQKPLFYLFAWALLSFLIVRIVPSKAVPSETYFYAWTTGLNLPNWRGMFFLLRLFLSIFSIEFIIASVNTPRRYFLLVSVTVFLYTLLCFYGVLQVFLYGVFGIQWGYIIFTPGTNFMFRIGGYVGEPQTFAGLIVSGYFLVLALLVRNPRPMKAFHKIAYLFILSMATIDLIFTFSVAMIIAVLITLALLFLKAPKSNHLIKLLFILFIGLFAFNLPRQMLAEKLIHEISTVNERTITWINGLHMLTKNPVTGVGIGQAPLVVSKFVTQDMASGFHNILFFDQARQPPMNSYIEWGAEMGTIGLFILFYFIFSLYSLSKQVKTPEQNFVNIAYGSGLAAMAIAANSSSGNFYIGYVSLSIAMFIAGMKIFGADVSRSNTESKNV